MPAPQFDIKNRISIGLSAAIIGMRAETPLILAVKPEETGSSKDILPFGPFDPIRHRTFELALRAFVKAQTGLQLGYVEQLYTFGDRGRHAQPEDRHAHVVSVGYLALIRSPGARDMARLAGKAASLKPWYRYFPWEDWRRGRPAILDDLLIPRLYAWARHTNAKGSNAALGPMERLKLAFALDDLSWDDERVLERYELLYEAGLVEEAHADGRQMDTMAMRPAPCGAPMQFDHRRILATAMSRLRAKIKYRPLVFELMAPEFTLTELQKTVEALAGRHLHKQNFRRLVESNSLVEATGATSRKTGGRPAQIFRFRHEALKERPAPGLRV